MPAVVLRRCEDFGVSMVSYEGSQTLLSGLSEWMLQRGGRAINHKRPVNVNFCVRFITSRDEGCTVFELGVSGLRHGRT